LLDTMSPWVFRGSRMSCQYLPCDLVRRQVSVLLLGNPQSESFEEPDMLANLGCIAEKQNRSNKAGSLAPCVEFVSVQQLATDWSCHC
jgi:hypothetical protein